MTSKTRKLLCPAVFLSLFALAFTFGPEGVAWFWAKQPPVAFVLAAGAAVCWVLVLASLRHRAG